MSSEEYIGLDVHQATISVAVMQGRHGTKLWIVDPLNFLQTGQ